MWGRTGRPTGRREGKSIVSEHVGGGRRPEFGAPANWVIRISAAVNRVSLCLVAETHRQGMPISNPFPSPSTRRRRRRRFLSGAHLRSGQTNSCNGRSDLRAGTCCRVLAVVVVVAGKGGDVIYLQINMRYYAEFASRASTTTAATGIYARGDLQNTRIYAYI